jgi:hypothetical protein
MKPKKTKWIWCAYLTLLVWSCDNSFSPKDNYQERFVVYCVLNPLEEVQFVRLYRTYDVDGVDPLKHSTDTPVSDAQITIDGGGQHAEFRDTVVKRDSYDRYSSDIVAYCTSGIRIDPRMSFQLSVTTQDDSFNARVTVPRSVGLILNDGSAKLIDPSHQQTCNCIRVRAQASGTNEARGYLFRLYIEYSRNLEGVQLYLRKEVPLRYAGGQDTLQPVFPFLDRSSTVDFSIDSFSKVLGEISADPANEVVGAKFITFSFDVNAYNYYQIVHGFGDPYSVRLDSPDYSNIPMGSGVFGALAVDSMFVPKKYW